MSLTPMQHVLIAQRFYAAGTFQRIIGDLLGVSVFAACTVILISGFQGKSRNQNDLSCRSLIS